MDRVPLCLTSMLVECRAVRAVYDFTTSHMNCLCARSRRACVKDVYCAADD